MKFSKLFPFENYTLVTRLTAVEVKEKISENIQLSKHFWSFKEYPARPYEGNVYDNVFIIRRVVHSRTSFLPVISGNIQEATGRTKITIDMRPATATMVF